MTGPDIGDLEAINVEPPFGLSHSGGSGFKLGNVYQCPRKAALKLLGWRVLIVGAPLWFGNIIHRHAFKPYLDADRKTVDSTACVAEVQEVCDTEKYTEDYTTFTGHTISTEQDAEVKPKHRKDLPRVAEAQMEVWEERRYPAERVVVCERRLNSELVDPVSGNVLAEMQGFRVLGRLDLGLWDGSHYAIRDLKTAASPLKPEWFHDIGYHQQLSTYRYLWAALRRETVDDLGCVQLTKNVQAETVRKHAGEILLRKCLGFTTIYNNFIGGVRRLLQYSREKLWPKNPYACDGKFRPCEFAPLCWADQYDDAEEWKKTLYRREDR